MLVLREFIFRAARGTGLVLPVPLLLGLLYPLAFARALFETLTRRARRTPTALPPGPVGASFRVELRERTSAWLSTAVLLWADRFNRPPWSARMDVHELDQLRALIATRPALIATLHFGGIFVMPTLLRAYGIPTAAVVGDKLWPVRWWRERRARLTQIDSLPAHLRSGDARAVMRYLEPGRCLLVALDYPIGDQVETPYAGASLRCRRRRSASRAWPRRRSCPCSYASTDRGVSPSTWARPCPTPSSRPRTTLRRWPML